MLGGFKRVVLTQVFNMWYKEFRKVYIPVLKPALSAKNKWEYYTISKSFLWSTWLYHCLLLLLFMLAFLFNFKQFCKVCKTLEGIFSLHNIYQSTTSLTCGLLIGQG
jgi:hypothetical protein